MDDPNAELTTAPDVSLNVGREKAIAYCLGYLSGIVASTIPNRDVFRPLYAKLRLLVSLLAPTDATEFLSKAPEDLPDTPTEMGKEKSQLPSEALQRVLHNFVTFGGGFLCANLLEPEDGEEILGRITNSPSLFPVRHQWKGSSDYPDKFLQWMLTNTKDELSSLGKTKFDVDPEVSVSLQEKLDELHRDSVTRGQEFMTSFNNEMAQLHSLQLTAFRDEDLRRIVETLGSRTERFFKSAVWPGQSTDVTFNTVIDRLKAAGIPKAARSKLHRLRELYNNSKHDPTSPLRLHDAVQVVAEAAPVLQSLIDLKIGDTTASVSKAASHSLWVSVYDDYVAGFSDVYVTLPQAHDPTYLDVFWMDITSWDALKRDLLQTGNFQYGNEFFPEHVIAKFNEKQDFLGAGVWQGNYGRLIAVLSLHEDRSIADKVFPFLRRDHMHIAVLSAIALAGVDVARNALEDNDVLSLTAAIVDRADTTYAMPSERPWVRRAAKHMATLLSKASPETRSSLTGPYWNLWSKQEVKAVLRSGDKRYARFLIDDADRVIIY